jgi:serine/threonine protein kinase
MALKALVSGSELREGKYSIVKTIAEDKFGFIYEGLYRPLNLTVTIREFSIRDYCIQADQTSKSSAEGQSLEQQMENFEGILLNEARALCRLNYPGIVRNYDIFEKNNIAYYVSDSVEGQTLNEIAYIEGALPEDRVVKYIGQIAKSLDYIHSMKMLHLDVNPSNVIIDNNDDAMLIDLGAVMQYDESFGFSCEPEYFPPEQLIGNTESFSPSTDIYALGATLYKLVTGATPPEASVIINEEIPYLPPTLSPGVCEAITRSLAQKQEERPQNIDEFLRIMNSDQLVEPVSQVPIRSLAAYTKSLWVDDFIDSHKNYFPTMGIPDIRESLIRADDRKIEEFKQCILVNPQIAHILSIFLGFLGVDRFFIRQNNLGILKLLYFVIMFGFFIYFVKSPAGIDLYYGKAILLLLLSLLWYVIDIFSIKKITRASNYQNVKVILDRYFIVNYYSSRK